MAKTQIISSGTLGVNDNQTIFLPLTGNLVAQTTEDWAQIAVRDSGTFSDLYIRVTTNTASVNSVFTFRLSKADTALAITYASDETGVKEDTDTVSAAATDEVNYQLAVPTEAGTNTITVTVIGISFTADSNTVTFCAAAGSNNYNGNATTDYIGIVNILGAQTEAQARVALRGSYTLSDLLVYISANARATSTVDFFIRVNGADGNSTVQYAAGETGAKEDASNSDSVVTGDLLAYSIVQGAESASTTAKIISCTCTSTSSEFPLIAGTTLTQSFNVTNYAGIMGRLGQASTTETDTQIIPNFDFSIKNLNASVTANSIATSDSTIIVWVAGGAGNGSLTYAAAETGVKVDTDNDAITGNTTTVNYQVITPNTSGSITIRNASSTGIVSSPPPPAVVSNFQMFTLMGVGT